MNINFIPLAQSHFLLLMKWLEAPHVKAWWPIDKNLLARRSFSDDLQENIKCFMILYIDLHEIIIEKYK